MNIMFAQFSFSHLNRSKTTRRKNTEQKWEDSKPRKECRLLCAETKQQLDCKEL